MLRKVILTFLLIDDMLALKYERVEKLDNHVCIMWEGAFDEVVRSLPECAVKCTSHSECQSLFYHTEQRTCYGCKSQYSTNAKLSHQPGTIYMQPVNSCPAGWIGFQGSCYLFGTVSMNIYSAQVWCSAANAQLVYVDNAAENTFLKSQMATVSGNETRHYYIGIEESSAPSTAGTWLQYGTQTVISYQDWYEEETSTGSRQCAIFSWQKSFQWDKVECTMPNCALCEQ